MGKQEKEIPFDEIRRLESLPENTILSRIARAEIEYHGVYYCLVSGKKVKVIKGE